MTGMTLIVKTITRLVAGFIAIYAAVTMLTGHLGPGGGFGGGVMLACAFILIVLAYGKQTALDIIKRPVVDAWDAFGVLAVTELIFIGLLGWTALSRLVPHGEPLALVSGGTVFASNLIVGLKVGVFLFAVFLALAAFRPGGNDA